MDKLDELRLQIDEIDKQMAILFEKRMNIVKEIANYKKDNNYPIYDQSRETFVLIRNGSYIQEKDIRVLYFEGILIPPAICSTGNPEIIGIIFESTTELSVTGNKTPFLSI